MNWREFFRHYRNIEIKNDSDLLYQVGTSVGGKPINHEQFICIIEEIKERLTLTPYDRLLDFCCGNGVITFELARIADKVVGIDGSEVYIKNAIEKKSSLNTVYIISDALDFEYIRNRTGAIKYTKVLFYGSLAYFDKKSFGEILNFFYESTTENSIILIGSILDRSKILDYFNTFTRRAHYILYYLILRRETGLGRWWSKSELIKISERHGFNISFFKQSNKIYTSNYRYNIILKKLNYKQN